MADAGGRFSAISAAEIPPIHHGSALVRGGLLRNKFSPPSPRRIPRRKFLFRQKIFLRILYFERLGSMCPLLKLSLSKKGNVIFISFIIVFDIN